jgi:2-polyprenyl-6-methoxyphenol hydroxylase-like FAD-dependent oxidoreductase
MRFGFRRHYRVVPWSEFVEVYWTKHGQLYVTPVGPEEVCVAFISRDSKLRLEDAFAVFPQIYARLKGADLITREQGAVSVTRALRSVYRGSSVLVGEASGSVDAITGDGLSMAFQQAHALAEAFVNDDLTQYQHAHRRIERLPRMMANLMLLMDRRQWLRARSLRALEASPNLFTRMLAVHTGELPLLGIGMEETLSFGWRLLRACNCCLGFAQREQTDSLSFRAKSRKPGVCRCERKAGFSTPPDHPRSRTILLRSK